MKHSEVQAASSRRRERDAIYIEYTVRTPWEGATWRSCSRIDWGRYLEILLWDWLTENNHCGVSSKSMEEHEGKNRLRNGREWDSHSWQGTVRFSGVGVSFPENLHLPLIRAKGKLLYLHSAWPPNILLTPFCLYFYIEILGGDVHFLSLPQEAVGVLKVGSVIFSSWY